MFVNWTLSSLAQQWLGTNGGQNVINSKYTYFRQIICLRHLKNASNMKVIALIPARYAATRFPAKLMQVLGNKTVIRHTYDNTVATGLFDEVIVVTDSEEIFFEITPNGGKAKMSGQQHQSGSD